MKTGKRSIWSLMKNWFTTDKIDSNSYIISEYRHWEETHCYLLSGTKRSLLIDTGLGVCDIADEVNKLTSLPAATPVTRIFTPTRRS